MYHINERITPFRQGAAAVALAAARRAKRPVACVPCGIKYQYVDDPTDKLLKLMDSLEQEIFWRPRPDLPLHERIYRFAEGAMALKELEYLRPHVCRARCPRGSIALARHILGQHRARNTASMAAAARRPSGSRSFAGTRSEEARASCRQGDLCPQATASTTSTTCFSSCSSTAIRATTWPSGRRSSGWRKHSTNLKRMCSAFSRLRFAAAAGDRFLRRTCDRSGRSQIEGRRGGGDAASWKRPCSGNSIEFGSRVDRRLQPTDATPPVGPAVVIVESFAIALVILEQCTTIA